MKPIILMDRVSFAYPAVKDQPEKRILKDFTLEINKGEVALISGKSGAGKTTLLRLIAWMETPDGGSMFLAGRMYSEYAPPALRRTLLMIPQIPVMLEGDVRSNLLLGCCEGPTDAELGWWMERLGMEPGLLGQKADSLSVGQKQRVALIRGILVKPKALLLDEPASGLDLESGELMRGLLGELAENDGMAVILCSHNTLFHDALAPREIKLSGEAK
jgi:putative ABC transport system ATP-binding protein